MGTRLRRGTRAHIWTHTGTHTGTPTCTHTRAHTQAHTHTRAHSPATHVRSKESRAHSSPQGPEKDVSPPHAWWRGSCLAGPVPQAASPPSAWPGASGWPGSGPSDTRPSGPRGQQTLRLHIPKRSFTLSLSARRPAPASPAWTSPPAPTRIRHTHTWPRFPLLSQL